MQLLAVITKRLVHAVQQDNVQHLLTGEMLLEASASHLADAVVGGDLVDRLKQGSIRIAPFTVARANVMNFVERQSTVNSPDDVRGPFVPTLHVYGDAQDHQFTMALRQVTTINEIHAQVPPCV
jgi:hypothetical protein